MPSKTPTTPKTALPRRTHRRGRGLLLAIVALGLVAAGCSSSDGSDLAAPTTLEIEQGSTTTADAGDAGDGQEASIDVPSENTDTSDATVTSAESPTTTEPGSQSTEPTDDTTTETTGTFTSSPPNDGDKIGCPEGLILVGSNGEEPICSAPGQGCPDGYVLIGGEDGAALCQDNDGLILRVYPDGTITPDTSVPFNGPICRRLDENGLLVEFGLATTQEECESRGGEYLPDGLP